MFSFTNHQTTTDKGICLSNLIYPSWIMQNGYELSPIIFCGLKELREENSQNPLKLMYYLNITCQAIQLIHLIVIMTTICYPPLIWNCPLFYTKQINQLTHNCRMVTSFQYLYLVLIKFLLAMPRILHALSREL